MLNKIRNGKNLSTFLYTCGAPVIYFILVYSALLNTNGFVSKLVYMLLLILSGVIFILYECLYAVSKNYTKRFTNSINSLICVLNMAGLSFIVATIFNISNVGNIITKYISINDLIGVTSVTMITINIIIIVWGSLLYSMGNFESNRVLAK